MKRLHKHTRLHKPALRRIADAMLRVSHSIWFELLVIISHFIMIWHYLFFPVVLRIADVFA